MYSAQITRKQKTAFIILLDQSGSMQEFISFQRRPVRKSEIAARFANLFIEELMLRSRRSEFINDYFDILALGYHGDTVEPILTDKIEFVPISKLYYKPAPHQTSYMERRMPGSGLLTISYLTYRCWVQPKAEGGTPMFAALMQCEKVAKRWCRRKEHRDSYPLIVINITDGEASDSDAQMLNNAARRIRETATEDGNTLLFNIHITSSDDERGTKFPTSMNEMPDNRLTRLMFDMSSTLPECYNELISEIKGERNTMSPYKAMCYNCSAEDLIKLLSIGTVSLDRM